jgi:hypothetical protein
MKPEWALRAATFNAAQRLNAPISASLPPAAAPTLCFDRILRISSPPVIANGARSRPATARCSPTLHLPIHPLEHSMKIAR